MVQHITNLHLAKLHLAELHLACPLPRQVLRDDGRQPCSTPPTVQPAGGPLPAEPLHHAEHRRQSHPHPGRLPRASGLIATFALCRVLSIVWHFSGRGLPRVVFCRVGG